MGVALDKYFNRVHTPEYTCINFADDIWRALGRGELIQQLHLVANTQRLRTSSMRNFTLLDTPESPCIAFLRSPGFHRNHVGIYMDRKILHLSASGVTLQPAKFVIARFNYVRFYK